MEIDADTPSTSWLKNGEGSIVLNSCLRWATLISIDTVFFFGQGLQLQKILKQETLLTATVSFPCIIIVLNLLPRATVRAAAVLISFSCSSSFVISGIFIWTSSCVLPVL